MEVWELLARAEIEDLVKRYAAYGDNGKYADMAGLFAEDGVFDSAGGPPIAGRPAIQTYMEGVAANNLARAPKATGGFVRHVITNTLVEFEDANTAQATSYLLMVGPDGLGMTARYRDAVVKTAEGWRFKGRRIRPDKKPA